MESLVDRLTHAVFGPGLLTAAIILPAASLPAAAQSFPEFPSPRLKEGRSIWLGTCEACHAHDVAGAPLVANKAAWAPRLSKGKKALYKSALGGLTGPEGTQMPPRGGNDNLTDDAVRKAVDYMMAIVR